MPRWRWTISSALSGRGASAEEELGNQTERATALAKAQSEAVKGAEDAEKEMALALLEQAKAQGRITDVQYKGGKIDIEERADMRRLEREKRERDESSKRQHDEVQAQHRIAEEDAGKVPEARAAADAARLAAEANARRIKNAQANEKSYAETNPEDMTPGLKESRERNKRLLETFQANQPGLQETANATRDRLASLESEAKAAQRKAESELAKAQAQDAANQVKTAADESNLRTRFGARRTMAGTKGDEEALNSPQGKLLGDVATAERTLQSGGHISLSQASQIATAAEMLKAAHISQGNEVLRALGGLLTTSQENRRQIVKITKQITGLAASR